VAEAVGVRHGEALGTHAGVNVDLQNTYCPPRDAALDYSGGERRQARHQR
jgi:hypothetical protein